MNQGPHEIALRPRRRSGTARVYVCGQISPLSAAQKPRTSITVHSVLLSAPEPRALVSGLQRSDCDA